MNLKKFITQNWIAIPSTIIAIVALIYAVYAHRKSTYEREPVFWSDPTKVQILDAERISEAPIKVIRTKDGSEITSNLLAATFSFWNNGRKSIKKAHILEDLKITIGDSENEIIDFKILRTSRALINFELTQDQRNSLGIVFDILEENDGATAQIMYTGNTKSDLAISGTIEEVRDIETIQKRPAFHNELLTFAASISTMLSFSIIGMLAIFIFIRKFFNRKRAEPITWNSYKHIFIVPILSLLFFLLILLVYLLLARNLIIPQSLLP